MLADQYVAGRRQRGEISRGTERNLSYHLAGVVAIFGDRPAAELDRETIETWQATMGAKTPATRRARMSSCRSFCRWLVTHGHLISDPVAGSPSIRQPRSVPRALPTEAIARLLAVVPDQRAAAVVWLMVGLGLRCMEVCAVEVADYDRRAATLFVTGKNANQRLLPVPLEAQTALDAYLFQAGHRAGPLVRSYRRPAWGIRPDTISGLVSGWMTAAGVKARAHDGVSAHALRHTAASDVLDRSHDLRVVQEMLGHARLATTAVYLRRADSAKLREAMEGRSYGPFTTP